MVVCSCLFKKKLSSVVLPIPVIIGVAINSVIKNLKKWIVILWLHYLLNQLSVQTWGRCRKSSRAFEYEMVQWSTNQIGALSSNWLQGSLLSSVWDGVGCISSLRRFFFKVNFLIMFSMVCINQTKQKLQSFVWLVNFIPNNGVNSKLLWKFISFTGDECYYLRVFERKFTL